VSVKLLEKLAALLTPKGAGDAAYAYWLHVQCDRCAEKIRTRIDLRNDPSIRYGETDRDTIYFCRKAIMGSGRCFQQIEVELTFDARRRLIDQQIQGGKFIDEEEYFDQVA
jgi:hypothetical protein